MRAHISSTPGRFAVVAVLLAGFPGLAACTSSADSPPPVSIRSSASAAWHEFVKCARENGMPSMPDPEIDSKGEAHFPNGTPNPPPIVEKACKSKMPMLSAVQGDDAPDGVTSAEIQALVRFARCMREKGIAQFPDPTPNGEFKLSGTPLEREGKSPRVLEAQNACKRLNPDDLGRIRVS